MCLAPPFTTEYATFISRAGFCDFAADLSLVYRRCSANLRRDRCNFLLCTNRISWICGVQSIILFYFYIFASIIKTAIFSPCFLQKTQYSHFCCINNLPYVLSRSRLKSANAQQLTCSPSTSSLTSSISWLCLDVSDCISLLNSSFVCNNRVAYNNHEKRRNKKCEEPGVPTITRFDSVFYTTLNTRSNLSAAQVSFCTFSNCCFTLKNHLGLLRSL